MVTKKAQPSIKGMGLFRRFSTRHHLSPLPTPLPSSSDTLDAQTAFESSEDQAQPSLHTTRQPPHDQAQPSLQMARRAKSLSPAVMHKQSLSVPPAHDRRDPDYPKPLQSRLMSHTSMPVQHMERVIPARGKPQSPMQLRNTMNDYSQAKRRLSPAQRHFLGLTATDGVDEGLVADAMQRKKSLSPANPGYVPLEQTSYGTRMNRQKALLIGIRYRNHKVLEELPGCTNDVKEMFALLTSELFGFPLNSVKVLSDELTNLNGVKVEQPTRFNILRDMKWLTTNIGKGDSVVFFFAGHGDTIVDVSGDEVETGFDQCIMPVDFMPPPKHGAGKVPFRGVSPILDDTIYERLVRAVPSGAKVTAIVDACRSGTVCDLPVVYDEQGRPRYRNGGCNPPREIRAPHKSAGGFVLFSGSADHQLSADMTIAKGGPDGGALSFGVMTRSFVEAMTEMACARDPSIYNGVESWTYGELFERIKHLVGQRTTAYVPQNFEVQEPQLSSSHLNIWEQPFTI